LKKIVENLFFGNYFYGFCVLALCLEATLQQNIPFLHPYFYIILFFTTIVYYTKAYIHLNDANSLNDRTKWYYKNASILKFTQYVYIILMVVLSILYLHYLGDKLIRPIILIPCIFPLAALLYYGLSTKGIAKNNLRNAGWLKPIIIGFTWAGVVTVFPLIMYWIESNSKASFDIMYVLLFLKNTMFVISLAILFDIKDYATDYNKEIKTFVVKYGLRFTIFYILIPLSIIGFGSFICVSILKNFSVLKIVFNTIPFVALFAIIYSMKKRRSILYYLVIIDGLLLLKGISGALGMCF
jgi:hypothetical protein